MCRPELEQFGRGPLRLRYLVVAKPLLCRHLSNGPAIIEERHRDEVVTEEPAPHTHQGEHSTPGAVLVGSDAVETLVTQDITDDVPPAGQMTECGVRSAADERIPFISVTVEWLQNERRTVRRGRGIESGDHMLGLSTIWAITKRAKTRSPRTVEARSDLSLWTRYGRVVSELLQA